MVVPLPFGVPVLASDFYASRVFEQTIMSEETHLQQFLVFLVGYWNNKLCCYTMFGGTHSSLLHLCLYLGGRNENE